MTTSPLTAPLPYAAPPADPPRWARLLMLPPGLIFFPLLILYSIVFFWTARLPGTITEFLLMGGFTLFFGTTWILRFLIAAVLWRIYRLPRNLLLPRLIRFGIAFALMVAVILADVYDLPSRATFYVCEPIMRRTAQDILLHPPAADPSSPFAPCPSGRFGLYSCNVELDTTSHAVIFIVNGAGSMDEFGYAYSPVPPTTNPGVVYYPSSGPWYRVVRTH